MQEMALVWMQKMKERLSSCVDFFATPWSDSGEDSVLGKKHGKVRGPAVVFAKTDAEWGRIREPCDPFLSNIVSNDERERAASVPN